jgi:hypothetical protein
MSFNGRLTPLAVYFRGSTAHQVEHAGKWLQILSQTGIDLHKYATEERNLHRHEPGSATIGVFSDRLQSMPES